MTESARALSAFNDGRLCWLSKVSELCFVFNTSLYIALYFVCIYMYAYALRSQAKLWLTSLGCAHAYRGSLFRKRCLRL